MRPVLPACLLAALLCLPACVGEIVTTPVSPDELVTVGNELHGVVGYRAMQAVEVSTFTQFSADGKTFTTDCVPAQSRKIVSIPDQSHPLLVSYRHGILEGYLFGVTMNADGVITGVNNTSNPDQGKTIANLADAALSTAKIAAGPAALAAHVGVPVKPGQILCNAMPTFTTYEPVPTAGLVKAAKP